MEQIINEFPEYKVTSDGSVINIRTNKILKPIKTKNGYLQVNLSIHQRRKSIMIHQLVAEAFLNKPENYGDGYTVINHKDGNKENNDFNNLEYVSQKYNVVHAFDNGYNINKGYNHPNSLKLSLKLVDEIVMLYECKDYFYSELAVMYDLSEDTIRRIISDPDRYDH